MQALFSWFTSQSGVSLLVALIALGGVLVNNRAAEKRRRADQVAADQRRKDDQAAEDARRKADDDRRERERLEQLQREDWARQRRVVAKCINDIFAASNRTKDEMLASKRARENAEFDDLGIDEFILLGRFTREAVALLNQCDFEITQPHVRAQIAKVWTIISNDGHKLVELGGDELVEHVAKAEPLSRQALREMRTLTIVARLALLEHPEHMAKQPVALLTDAPDTLS